MSKSAETKTACNAHDADTYSSRRGLHAHVGGRVGANDGEPGCMMDLSYFYVQARELQPPNG